MPPLHFMVEPRTLHGVVADRVLLVARRAGAAVAFLVASPVAARNGFLIEQVARSPRAPNGSSELLIDAAMRRFAEDGRVYVTLGLVALSSQAGDRECDQSVVAAPDDDLRTRPRQSFLQFSRARTLSHENVAGVLGNDLRDLQRAQFFIAHALRDRRRVFGHLTLARNRSGHGSGFAPRRAATVSPGDTAPRLISSNPLARNLFAAATRNRRR